MPAALPHLIDAAVQRLHMLVRHQLWVTPSVADWPARFPNDSQVPKQSTSNDQSARGGFLAWFRFGLDCVITERVERAELTTNDSKTVCWRSFS